MNKFDRWLINTNDSAFIAFFFGFMLGMILMAIVASFAGCDL